MRSRNANSLIATWLNEPPQGLRFVEPDYDSRLPSYRSISETRYFLATSLRLRVVSTGVSPRTLVLPTLPVF